MFIMNLAYLYIIYVYTYTHIYIYIYTYIYIYIFMCFHGKSEHDGHRLDYQSVVLKHLIHQLLDKILFVTM